jgi:hypothetical protein
MPRTNLILMIAGPICSGKSHIAEKLSKLIPNCEVVSHSVALKELLELTPIGGVPYIWKNLDMKWYLKFVAMFMHWNSWRKFGPPWFVEKPRDHLVYIGHGYRKLDKMVWSKALKKTLDLKKNYIIDDFRYPSEEAKYLKAFTLGIEADQFVLEARHSKLYGTKYPKLNGSENALKYFRFDFKYESSNETYYYNLDRNNPLNTEEFVKHLTQLDDLFNSIQY